MKKGDHVSVDTNKLERMCESRSINCVLSPINVQFTGFLKDYSSYIEVLMLIPIVMQAKNYSIYRALKRLLKLNRSTTLTIKKSQEKHKRFNEGR